MTKLSAATSLLVVVVVVAVAVAAVVVVAHSCRLPRDADREELTSAKRANQMRKGELCRLFVAGKKCNKTKPARAVLVAQGQPAASAHLSAAPFQTSLSLKDDELRFFAMPSQLDNVRG